MEQSLQDRLRQLLREQARTGDSVTYRDLAQRLGLTPPGTIRQVAQALESLMAEDAAAGRPLLAALVVSRKSRQAGPALPAPGFFLAAQALGLFADDPAGAEAAAFHRREFKRAVAFYGRS